MNKRFFLLLLTLTIIMMITVACSSNSEEDGAQNNEEESAQSKEDENEMSDSDDSDDSDNGENKSDLDDKQNNDKEKSSSSEDSSSASDNDLPDTIEINEEILHPNGVTLTLEKITFEEDHISVNFNAQNGFGDTVYLADSGRTGVTLEDDVGNTYRYVVDDDSAEIELKDQEKVTGKISFLGKIKDDAKSLTLIFNGAYGLDNEFASVPKFVFEDIEIKR